MFFLGTSPSFEVPLHVPPSAVGFYDRVYIARFEFRRCRRLSHAPVRPAPSAAIRAGETPKKNHATRLRTVLRFLSYDYTTPLAGPVMF